MKTIVVLTPLSEKHRAAFDRFADRCEIVFTEPGKMTDDLCRRASVVMGDMTPGELARCESLELIQLANAGAERYDRTGVLPAGARLACATGCYGLAIAEHLLGCLLAMQKNLYKYYVNPQRRVWHGEGHVQSVYGSTALIVGAGDIGCEFAKRLKSMGAYTPGVRRTNRGKPDCFDEMYSVDRLDELLPRADIVSLSLPATAQTKRLLNENNLPLLRDGAYLLNVGRGSTIDTDALCREAPRLGGVSLDVTDPEPLPPEHPLWAMDNVFITPHMAGRFNLPATLDKIVALAVRNIEALLSGGKIESLVDPETGYGAKE